MRRFALGYEYICRIILMVLVTHVAFIVHTVMGLVVVGLFPSIGASYATYRTWLLDVDDRMWGIKQTWVVFHKAWKDGLVRDNLFGYPQFIVWVLLMVDYWIANSYDLGGKLGVAVSGMLLLINVVYGVFVFFSWVMRANFNMGIWWTVRMSFQMVIARPLCSFMLLVVLLLTAWAYFTWPGLFMAFSVSVPIFFAVLVVYSFGRIPGMDIHVLEPLEEKEERKRKRYQFDAEVTADNGADTTGEDKPGR